MFAANGDAIYSRYYSIRKKFCNVKPLEMESDF
jgi:hypothetical protein